jgi:hypothetical protein
VHDEGGAFGKPAQKELFRLDHPQLALEAGPPVLGLGIFFNLCFPSFDELRIFAFGTKSNQIDIRADII